MDPSGSRLALRKKLADFIHDTSFEKLPQNLIHQTKLRLLDLIGVSIAGGCQNVASILSLFTGTLYSDWAPGMKFFGRASRP